MVQVHFKQACFIKIAQMKSMNLKMPGRPGSVVWLDYMTTEAVLVPNRMTTKMAYLCQISVEDKEHKIEVRR